ncbi:MAG: hypothetical protein GWP65_06295 [Nitrosopumilaceae archaeon]|nr:hypothetical protein [Nitrosopumilaceae archaeon]
MVDLSLAEKLFTDNSASRFMDSCASGYTDDVCWFCRKGRHGPHDCTFDTKMIPCKCQH